MSTKQKLSLFAAALFCLLFFLWLAYWEFIAFRDPQDVATTMPPIIILAILAGTIGGIVTSFAWCKKRAQFVAFTIVSAPVCAVVVSIVSFSVLDFFSPAPPRQPLMWDRLMSTLAGAILYSPGIAFFSGVPGSIASAATAFFLFVVDSRPTPIADSPPDRAK